MKIIFSSNISWSIYNFRKGLLTALKQDGHDIYTVASEDEYSLKLMNLGFHFNKIDINNNSKNPINDLKLIIQYLKIYKKINPDIILHNAIKPNIYGTMAARILGIRTINNISGLGTLFIKESFSTKIAKFLYKFSQKGANIVFFQNNDDLELFLSYNLVQQKQCKVIPGSGVDTNKFRPVEGGGKKNDIFKFLFVGRLIYDKGIREYVSASKKMYQKKYNIQCNILGPIYKSNETSISNKELKDWVDKGYVNYLGESDDVYKELIKTHCLVLPSYREGLSKVLIEAMSSGIPIVTTNVPGCKDVIIDNVTGFLCEVKNSNDLALKMEKMLSLGDKDLKKMGLEARKRAIEVFDEQIIINYYKKAINSLVK